MEELFQKAQEPDPGAEEQKPVPEGEVRQVKELLQALMKTKRAHEMYPSNNPLLGKFQDDLNKRFDELFAEQDRLTLLIGNQEIRYKGQQVYHNQEKDDNLALLFYKDGLRELTFKEGFSGDELLDFINVIRARPETSDASFDDDIVTLLWEKDFMHLSYYVVEEFVEGSSLEDDEVARLLSRRDSSEGGFEEAYKDSLTAEEETGKEEIFSPLESISMGFKGIFSLGEEEVKSLKEEMEGLTDERFLEGAIYGLFESIYIDKGTPDFNILMNNLDSALGYLLYTGGFGMAALILKRFRELANNSPEFNKAEIDRMRQSISRAGSEARIKTIADLINTGGAFRIEEFKTFLSQLDKNAIIPLSNLIGEVKDVGLRKVVTDILVSLGRENIDSLAVGLKSGKPSVVRNVAAILGRIGDKASLDHLKGAMSHPEPNVRREIVRALGMVGGHKAGEILMQSLEDPDQQIRMAVLRYLPGTQSFSLLDTLVEIITRPDFSEKTLPEKRVFFEVLAEVGQDRVLPFLVKLLKNKSFFGSAKKEESRISAAYGLGNIHQKEALEALERESGRTKKGTALFEALSYSIHKLTMPSGAQQEVL
ncbi:MAG: HEAT repeat domain-containing protein [Nitrospirota bacterium]